MATLGRIGFFGRIPVGERFIIEFQGFPNLARGFCPITDPFNHFRAARHFVAGDDREGLEPGLSAARPIAVIDTHLGDRSAGIIENEIAVRTKRHHEINQAFMMAGGDGGVFHFFDVQHLDQILPHVEVRRIAGNIGDPAREIGGKHAMLQAISQGAFAAHMITDVVFIDGGRSPAHFLEGGENRVFEFFLAAHDFHSCG